MIGNRRRLTAFGVAFLFVVLYLGFFLRRIYHPQKRLDPEPEVRAVVRTVYDGDTVKVEFEDSTERSVRLIGVDCAEIDDDREDVRFQALMAKRYAFFKLYRKKVTLTFDWEREDRHRRLLAYVRTGSGELFNRRIIEDGFASAFLKYPFREDFRADFIEAEREARRKGTGLWRKEPCPILEAGQASQNLGRMVTVKYECVSVDNKRGFVFLLAEDRIFAALIPDEEQSLFPEIGSCQGSILSVTGFLEEFRGQPQVLVYFPWQIEKGNPAVGN
jgi:micrococcal nuclease